jgi:predicted 2-oxoglutarate/Fe(II)-dependent dioxygenase YbiX
MHAEPESYLVEALAKADGKMNSVDDIQVPADVPLLIQRAFLDGETCVRIRRAMDLGTDDAAEIVADHIERHETVRRARSIEIESEILELVETRLEEVRTAVERTVKQSLGEREGTGFLRYQPGGFYRRHRDRGRVDGWPAAARRLITVVIFLNGGFPGDRRREFAGGELCLYPDLAAEVRIRPETGLLIAFPAGLLHEVQPVSHGTRDTVIDWFYEASGVEPPL